MTIMKYEAETSEKMTQGCNKELINNQGLYCKDSKKGFLCRAFYNFIVVERNSANAQHAIIHRPR
jgi:hypothetical protein